jgi:uncharacterized protein YndB with AHSA1/START domain
MKTKDRRMDSIAGQTNKPRKGTFSIERTYCATVDELWALWTTKAGLESWWGPEGFEIRVIALELEPGGEWTYEMTATGVEQQAFMRRSGMATSTTTRVTYTEVSPTRRLAYKMLADFVPEVAPYDVGTMVEFEPIAEGVRLKITFDGMHDDLWSDRARAGHESQVRKLDALLESPTIGASA